MLEKEFKEYLEYILEVQNSNLQNSKLEETLEELKLERKVRELKVIELKELYQNYKKRLERQRKSLTHRKETLLKIHRLEKILAALEEITEALINEKRAELQKFVSSALRTLTNKPQEFRKVEIGDDYKPNIMDINTEWLSEGEKQVLGLSFAAGLRNELLVIDAPFTRLDSVHKKNLIKALSNFAEQLIILVTDEDFREIKGLATKVWKIEHDQSIRSSKLKCIST
jgi:DNA sulfur modification protein DndD